MSKIEKTENELQQEAANKLLDKGVKFKIKGIGSFEIKPLKLCTLVEISKEALKIDKIEGKDISPMQVIATSKNSAFTASRLIAKAILRDRYKMKFFSGILSRKIYNTLTPEELQSLVLVIISQSKADFFFSSINLLGAMRIMQANTKETTAFGEQLPD